MPRRKNKAKKSKPAASFAAAEAGARMLAAAAKKRMKRRARNRIKKSVGPRMSDYKERGDSVLIEAKELVKIVSGTTEFNNELFIVNPLNSKLFPRLSQIARLFQEWKAESVTFHFVSTSAVAIASTNTALGQVVMAANYNTVAPAFVSVEQAVVDSASITTSPAKSANFKLNYSHVIVGKDGRLLMPYRDDPTANPTPLTDLAEFQFMTEGMQTESKIGYLWVSYKMRLFKPTLRPRDDSNFRMLYGLSGLSPLVTVTLDRGAQELSWESKASSTTFTFPRSTAVTSKFVYFVTYSSAGNITYTNLAASGCQVADAYLGAPQARIPYSSGGSWNGTSRVTLLTIPVNTEATLTYTFGPGQSLPSPAYYSLYVGPVSNAAVAPFLPVLPAPAPFLLPFPSGVPEPEAEELKEESL